MEVSPMSIALVQEVAKRIQKSGGCALFIDYGEDHPQGNTLRAYKRHKEVNMFENPGDSDITADVDFAALRRCVGAMENVKYFGPIVQGLFLQNMGALKRAEILIDQPHVSDDEAELICDGLMRLMEPSQMGSKYKVFAVMESNQKSAAGFPIESNTKSQ
eukprot:CAMPEP_0171458256 /NCGR_PEP_ID=MMETSP0945-20130129/4009_1 /TAXON_ID=109269 /ORGANISM="Vaucheria litorea, Strain CCMP2940" /LENGTH=159 /DNA_ID=CAMNT_0011984031 /DNA_START=967 /DNA_END=1446 /DNA_ORIENTATION=+